MMSPTLSNDYCSSYARRGSTKVRQKLFYVSLLRLILTSTSVLPVLFEDVNNRMKEWGTEGKINPFSEIYDVSLYSFGECVCDNLDATI